MAATRAREETVIPRLFELFFLLLRTPASGPAIQQHLAHWYSSDLSGERMLQRDISRLRKIGCVIQARPNPRGYVLHSHPFDRYLNAEHVLALTFIIKLIPASFPLKEVNELLSYFLGGIDPEQRSSGLNDQIIRTWLHPVTDYAAAAPLFRPLYAAIEAQRQVCFRYATPTERRIPHEHVLDPLAFEYREGHFYLVGYAHEWNTLIDYRLDRIDQKTLRQLDAPVSNPERDLYPFAFRYWLAPELVRRGISQRFARQEIFQTFDDGAVEIAACARSSFYAVRGLLRYAANARATWPPALIEELKHTLDATRARYD